MLLKNKKGFTLVEMLIVIVIIGILATALIPKLMGAKDQANDTARLSHLNQIGTALAIYGGDNNGIPSGSGNADNLLSGMVGTYIKSIDKDPQITNPSATFCNGASSTAGHYFYGALNSNNYVLVANTQVAKKGNRDQMGTGCTDVNTLPKTLSAITLNSGDMYIYAN